MKIKPPRCLYGLFMRYFISRRIPLKFYLYFMIIIDTILALINLSNLVLLFKRPNNTEQKDFSREDQTFNIIQITNFCFKLLFYIPTMALEIHLILKYKLTTAKILYSMKLLTSCTFLLYQFIYFLFDRCYPLLAQTKSITYGNVLNNPVF